MEYRPGYIAGKTKVAAYVDEAVADALQRAYLAAGGHGEKSRIVEEALKNHPEVKKHMKTYDVSRLMITWRKESAYSYVAEHNGCRLEAYYDDQPGVEPGWCWRVTRPDGYQDGDVADDLEDAKYQAETTIR